MKNKIDLVAGGMLTIREAAELSGLGKSFLYNRMADGDLVYTKIRGARRIPRMALLEYLAKNLVCGSST